VKKLKKIKNILKKQLQNMRDCSRRKLQPYTYKLILMVSPNLWTATDFRSFVKINEIERMMHASSLQSDRRTWR
jgi:hypothetical protein